MGSEVKKFIIAIVMIIMASSVFAQNAPDYTDQTKWEHYNCGEIFAQPKDTNYHTWHDDYFSIVPGNKDSIIIVYRPISKDIQKGKEYFINTSRNQPWLMLVIIDGEDQRAQLFEYKNDAWEYITSDSKEIYKLLDEEYNLE